MKFFGVNDSMSEEVFISFNIFFNIFVYVDVFVFGEYGFDFEFGEMS